MGSLPMFFKESKCDRVRSPRAWELTCFFRTSIRSVVYQGQCGKHQICVDSSPAGVAFCVSTSVFVDLAQSYVANETRALSIWDPPPEATNFAVMLTRQVSQITLIIRRVVGNTIIHTVKCVACDILSIPRPPLPDGTIWSLDTSVTFPDVDATAYLNFFSWIGEPFERWYNRSSS